MMNSDEFPLHVDDLKIGRMYESAYSIILRKKNDFDCGHIDFSTNAPFKFTVVDQSCQYADGANCSYRWFKILTVDIVEATECPLWWICPSPSAYFREVTPK